MAKEADRKLINRVARAICVADGRHWNNLRETQRVTYRRRAEAAMVEVVKRPCPRCATAHGGVGLVNIRGEWLRCRTCQGDGALLQSLVTSAGLGDDVSRARSESC